MPGASSVVVLGHGLWPRRFGADPGLVGRSIRIDGLSHTVVGVMPRGLRPHGERRGAVGARGLHARAARRARRALPHGGGPAARRACTREQAHAELERADARTSRRASPQATRSAASRCGRCGRHRGGLERSSCWCCWARWGWCCSSPAPTWPTSCSRAAPRARASSPCARRWARGAGASCASCSPRACCWRCWARRVGLALAWARHPGAGGERARGHPAPGRDAHRRRGAALRAGRGAAQRARLRARARRCARRAATWRRVLRQGARGAQPRARRAARLAHRGRGGARLHAAGGRGAAGAHRAAPAARCPRASTRRALVIAQVGLPKARYESPEQVTRAFERVLESLEGAPGVAVRGARPRRCRWAPAAAATACCPRARPETRGPAHQPRRRVVSPRLLRDAGHPAEARAAASRRATRRTRRG